MYPCSQLVSSNKKTIGDIVTINTKQLRTVTGSSKPYIIIGSSSKHGNQKNHGRRNDQSKNQDEKTVGNR